MRNLRALVLLVMLSGVLQPKLPSTTFTSTAHATQTVRQNCPATLSYKSCLGLMPPAYGLDPTARIIQADPDAPRIDFLNPARNIATGSWPQVLAAGNFNDDRRADVAVAAAHYFDPPNDEQLHLFTAQTGGILTRTLRLPAGAFPEAIATTDVNLDGHDDVALALGAASNLAVYSQTTTLAGPLRLTLPSPADALAAGDFSGDLRPDLAVATPLNNAIHLFQSSATGLIDNRTSLPYTNAGFNALSSGDLDNDGDDDLAALRGAGYDSDAVVVYLQDQEMFPLSTILTPTTGGYLPHSLTAGDVNSDGRDDLVVTAGGNTPNAYLNLFMQDDSGLVTEPITAAAFHLPSAVAVADINHDGREDVVAVHDAWRTLSVYTQTVELELAPYASMDVPYSSRYRPHALALADFDGNGSLDVALVGQEAGLTVITNTLTAPTAAISWPPEAATLPLGTLTVTGTASTSAVAVEVRLRGGTTWFPATLDGSTWRVDIEVPNGSRPWTIEARAIDADGHVQAPTARRRIRVAHFVYLPLVYNSVSSSAAPDLVGSFSLAPNKQSFVAGEQVLITAVVTNQGTAKAYPFWVDLFINPGTAPTAANTIWSQVCGLTPCYGIAWGVANGLEPGQSITLTSTADSYSGGHTIWSGYFASGTTDLYLYVDSWNPGVVVGAAAEGDETNNRTELHGLQVTGPNPMPALQRQAGDLPPRPAQP